MNYRHAFHAGNFADVDKHAVLARILVHLKAKPAAFRMIDTHAGAGRYDLTGPEATPDRRMARGHRPPAARPRSRRPSGRCSRPISTSSQRSIRALVLRPIRARRRLHAAHLRPQDRLLACELEPEPPRRLRAYFPRRPRIRGGCDRRLDRAHRLCAAKGAPRRGADRSRVRAARRACPAADRFAAAHRKWPSGTYVLWYPIKARRDPEGRTERETFVGGSGGSAIPRSCVAN